MNRETSRPALQRRRAGMPAGIFPALLVACLLLTLTLATASARAAERDIPAAAMTGMLVVGVFPAGEINGEPVRFAPAARIVGQDNRLVLPSTISGQSQRIAYQRDQQGLVTRVWLITAEQARALAAMRAR